VEEEGEEEGEVGVQQIGRREGGRSSLGRRRRRSRTVMTVVMMLKAVAAAIPAHASASASTPTSRQGPIHPPPLHPFPHPSLPPSSSSSSSSPPPPSLLHPS